MAQECSVTASRTWAVAGGDGQGDHLSPAAEPAGGFGRQPSRSSQS